MINPEAVEQFLARTLRDSDKTKRFTDAALQAKLDKLNPQPDFHTPPHTHQKAGFLLGTTYHAYLFFYEMGLGKTKQVLDLFAYFNKCGTAKRMLVLVPNASNIYTWQEEIHKHTPDLTIGDVDGLAPSADGSKLLTSDIVVMTYSGWMHRVCSLQKVRGRVHRKMIVDEKLAKRYEQQFQLICFDEITSCKNHKSTTSKLCRRLSHKATYRFGLAGRPFSKDPADLWNIFYLIDHGETLGETLGIYRAAFFHETDDWFAGTTYEFDKKKDELLYRTLRNRSLRYMTSECMDLPELVCTRRKVTFSKEIEAYHQRAMDNLKKAEGNLQLLSNEFLRARSICSGWFLAKDEMGGKLQIDFNPNPKLDELMVVLEETGDSKVIVFNEFLRTGDIISKALDAAKIKHTRLSSKTTNRAKVQDTFIKDPACRVFLSSTAGAFGLNLQVANYVIFFETPTSPLLRSQMIARSHRFGQAKTVYVIDLEVHNSIESRILASLESGEDLYNRVVNGLEAA